MTKSQKDEAKFLDTRIDDETASFIEKWNLAILAAALSDELVIYSDFPPGKVQISLCQPAELADTHSGSQQHYKLVVILAVGLVLPDEIHPKCLLFLCHGNALL